jgi:nucleoside-diphosphate-sugar epimerase
VILVTGGTGFVGRHLVDALAARGDEVRVLTRSDRLSKRSGVTMAVGDLSDEASLDRAASGARVVVHLAARLSPAVGDASAWYDFNVRTSASLAGAARRAGVERFIHVSSGGVYGDGTAASPHAEADVPHPGNAYERSKLAAEQAVVEGLASSGTSCAILRPAGVYGRGRPVTEAFFNEVRRRRLWVHGTPNVIVHPTHVSDVVQACTRLLDHPDVDGVLNVAGERALPFQDLVALTAAALGVRARQLVVPAAVGRPIGRIVASVLAAAHAPVPATLERAGRPWVNRALDISRARARLGFVPIELAAGLRASLPA